MGDTILLFESRDLCYESNQYFMECLVEAFEQMGYPVERCDLSLRIEEKLEKALECQENYLAAIDFNSLLPRAELSDGTAYLDVFCVPFFNYLVDHPLYHHVALRRGFPHYHVLCVDQCHRGYIAKYYPEISHVLYLPLGAMQANLPRSWDQKRLELLFLGTYEPEDVIYQELEDYPAKKRTEILCLMERMQADWELTQERALAQYLQERDERLSREEFADRLHSDYLADKYLRNLRRRMAVEAAAKANVPFTVVGHGWDSLKSLSKGHITVHKGVGFAASLQLMADARMLLNTTPGFCGGLHDRVYSAMINRALCFTENTTFAREHLLDGGEAILYGQDLSLLTERIVCMQEHPGKAEEIALRAYERAASSETWQKRAERMLLVLHNER